MNTNKTLRDALDEAFPMPDTPHASVATRAIDNRAAFTKGWAAALAIKDAPALEAVPVGIVMRYNEGGRGERNNIEPVGKLGCNLADELPFGTLLYTAPAKQEAAPHADAALAERGTVGEPVQVAKPKVLDLNARFNQVWNDALTEAIKTVESHKIGYRDDDKDLDIVADSIRAMKHQPADTNTAKD